MIVYHNLSKFSHFELHQDIWENGTEPFVANDKEIYIKLEMDQEAVESLKAAQHEARMLGVQKQAKITDEEGAEESKSVAAAEG